LFSDCNLIKYLAPSQSNGKLEKKKLSMAFQEIPFLSPFALQQQQQHLMIIACDTDDGKTINLVVPFCCSPSLQL